MDLTLITSAVGSLKAAADMAKAAVAIRDSHKLTEVVVSMNEQLLNAQQSLFAHNAELLALQQEHFQATQKLRELEETLSERRRYTLFELAPGKFVYRADARPVLGGSGDEIGTEPEHYICQPCFDGVAKTKVVLQSYGSAFRCPACKCLVGGGESEPGRRLAANPRWGPFIA